MAHPSVKKRIMLEFIVIIVLFIAVFPFMWMVFTSLKTEAEVYKLALFPKQPQIGAYLETLRKYDFLRFTLNSSIVTVLTTLISIVVGSFAAYSFARFSFPGGQYLLIAFMVVLMLPPIVFVIPLYRVLNSINLIDTFPGLILADMTFTIPLVTWMMRGFFATIPRDLEEAARIDGCTYWGAFFKVVWPLSAPGMAATAIFIFIITWNEFLYALSFTSSTEVKPLTVAVSEFIGQFEIDWTNLMAGGTITCLPVMLVAFVFQRYLMAGLLSGSLKG